MVYGFKKWIMRNRREKGEGRMKNNWIIKDKGGDDGGRTEKAGRM